MSCGAPERRRAIPELRQVIQSLLDGSAVPPEATLIDVRNVLQNGIFISDGELLYPQDRTFLVIELDELIDRDGPRAAARDYVAPDGEPPSLQPRMA